MNARTMVLSFAIFASPLWAANFSGKWLLTGEAAAGGRAPAPIVVTLNQVGTEVTGNITPPRGNSTGSPANVDVFAGKVDGDNISFYVWTGRDKPVKNMYKGTLKADEIMFTVTLDNATQAAGSAARSFQVTAKRIP
jgi:hypothetical protein